MARYACDVPAFVTVRFEARNDAHAKYILRGMSKVPHEFGVGDQETEVDGVLISPAITLYPEGIEGDAFSATRLYEEDALEE